MGLADFMKMLENLHRTEVTFRCLVQKQEMLCEPSFWQQRFWDSSRMAFFFVATSHGESGYGGVWTVKWLVARTSIQWSYYSYCHSSSNPCFGRVHHSNFKFYVGNLLVLREGNILVPLLHKCQYCMWHTGALCLSTNKKYLLATNCYFLLFQICTVLCMSAPGSMVHWKSQVFVTAIYIDLTVIWLCVV